MINVSCDIFRKLARHLGESCGTSASLSDTSGRVAEPSASLPDASGRVAELPQACPTPRGELRNFPLNLFSHLPFFRYFCTPKIISMPYECEQVLPYQTDGSKKAQIEQMFDAISDNYDFMNRTMTLGIDRRWRRRAIDSLTPFRPRLILDVATGTGDFAIEAFEKLQCEKIIGVDISEKMLEIGRIKIAKSGLSSHIELTQGDSMHLNFDDELFDAATVAFGVRNFESLERGISEMQRVLKMGGHLVILELSEPFVVFKPFYRIYSKWIIPLIARLFIKDKQAYNYLPASIEHFPKRKEMTELLTKCGFSQVISRRFTFGVCAFYICCK